MSKHISVDSILESFPNALSNDENMEALAAVVATAISRLFDDTKELSIYPQIDALKEELLDMLASDFDVKWYYYDGTIASKREQIKNHFAVHRTLGTKSAIIDAVSGLCDKITITEWYEYGGRPGHFTIDLTPKTGFEFSKVLRYVNYVKRVSACLDAIGMHAYENTTHYVGLIVIPRNEYHSAMDINDLDLYLYLTDENGVPLEDENKVTLFG